jgi:hypothetical protein
LPFWSYLRHFCIWDCNFDIYFLIFDFAEYPDHNTISIRGNDTLDETANCYPLWTMNDEPRTMNYELKSIIAEPAGALGRRVGSAGEAQA